MRNLQHHSKTSRHCIMKVTAILFIVLLLGGCDRETATGKRLIPTPIEAGDECHVCGMLVNNFPGPKAQAFIRHQEQPLKFCSTTDLFSWLLQPDTPAILLVAYVHDMGRAPAWDKPGDEDYVVADQAWYVIGHDMPGAMGPTLASYKEEAAARAFMQQHGGRLLRHEEINLSVLAELMQGHSH